MRKDLLQEPDVMFTDIMRQAKEVTTYSDMLLRQDNRLAQESTSSVTYVEHRIIFALLTIIERDQDGFSQWYKIYLPSLSTVCHVDVRSIRTTSRKLQKTFAEKILYIMSEDGSHTMAIPWFAAVLTNDEYLCVKMNEEIKPWVTELEKSYTEERLSALVGYGRHASMILHNFICSKYNRSASGYRDVASMEKYVHHITMSIEGLRFLLLSYGEKSAIYIRNAHLFINDFIIPALKEINERGYFWICPVASDGNFIRNGEIPMHEYNEKLESGELSLFTKEKHGKSIHSLTFRIMAGPNNTRLQQKRNLEIKMLKEDKTQNDASKIQGMLNNLKPEQKNQLVNQLIEMLMQNEVEQTTTA